MGALLISVPQVSTLANCLFVILISTINVLVNAEKADKISVACSQHSNCISFCSTQLGFNKGPSCCLVEKKELEDQQTTVDLGNVCYCCEHWPEAATDFSKYPSQFTIMNAEVCEWYQDKAILPGPRVSKSVLHINNCRRQFCGNCYQAWIPLNGGISRRDVPSACMLSLEQRMSIRS